ncbi:relaxase/mobilization nuclease domain-containing protein [Sphingomonas sp. Leaf230]|uniref:relaxase/mobilization nuclease domain-containing protein n=1 Tax=Sphingomonas sp. Leaf230 TaxID=1735694 RepID=UPI0009EC55A1|nr:relaxase/mobilization nuclease domain-containing protein [Sphingomonas sp. Leaf230]
MIVKKIPARPAGRNATIERATHARRLVDYLRLPDKESAERAHLVEYMLSQKLADPSTERLFHIGARGFVSKTIEGQRAEMIAVAQEARRSPNPVDHWLLSWREDELPTPDQVDAVVALFVEHLDVADQPCIYACHGDTRNRHVHLALNRYDCATRRMIEINDGFTLEAAHQAVALIVDRFGWQAEKDARYEVGNGRPVLTASALARIEDGRESIRPAAAAFENRTGYRSAQRIAQDDALPRIRAARSWAELHASLAGVGTTYDLTGTNGVTIGVGNERVKASIVDRAITRTRLEKRLGGFQPRDAAIPLVTRLVDDDRFTEALRAEEYRAACEQWRKLQDDKRKARAGRTTEIGKPVTATTIARAAAREQASAKAGKVKRPPPDLQSFYYAHGEGVLAERWPHRHRVSGFPSLHGGRRAGAVSTHVIEGYTGYPCADGMRYARGPQAPTAFLDRGPRIDVIADDDAALLGALRLAAWNFDGKVSVSGSAAFRERVYTLAKAHGLSGVLNDPDFVRRRAVEVSHHLKNQAVSVVDSAVAIASILPPTDTDLDLDTIPAAQNTRRRPDGPDESGPPIPRMSQRAASEPAAERKRSRERSTRDVAGPKPGGLFDLASNVEKPENEAKAKGPTDTEAQFPVGPPGKGHSEGR